MTPIVTLSLLTPKPLLTFAHGSTMVRSYAQPAPPLGQERARPAILEVVGDGGWKAWKENLCMSGPKITVHERQDPPGIVEVN
jgi:hypothetical protein